MGEPQLRSERTPRDIQAEGSSARSREPLVHPEPAEREGYVPNVVYTCGAMRHRDQIIFPYAISDTFSNFATIKIADLMESIAD